MQDVGGPIGQRHRGHRANEVKASVGEALYQLKTAQAEPSNADARDRADTELSDEEENHVGYTEVGLVDEFDEIITSSTAKGSTIPASASSVRDSLPGSLTCRRSANTAALSVAARIDPRSRPCSNEKSNSQTAASPVIAAVRKVPTVRDADCGPQYRPDLREACGEARLE